jgi:phosphoribosylformylglycinamidine cyclo-ligase
MGHYKAAGVDIDAGIRAVELMKAAVRSTYTPQVLTDVGSFGGLFALERLPAQPVLVASTDGVGTKVKLAAQLGRWQGIGHDLVNHCVNDILVQNARPLFFLDYVATSQLDPQVVATIVTGMAEACRTVGCALIGGETAEMPGVYLPGAVDVAGAVVGLVDRAAILPRLEEMTAGDRLIGLPSSGPHTNGYSLIRRLVADQPLAAPLAGTTQTLADALLAPHRCYLAEIDRLQAAGVALKGLAHITGGGLLDNLPRVLPRQLTARVQLPDPFDPTQRLIPPLFQQLLRWAELPLYEAARVFNLGVGLVLIVEGDAFETICRLLPEAFLLGELVTRQGEEAQVRLVEAMVLRTR